MNLMIPFNEMHLPLNKINSEIIYYRIEKISEKEAKELIKADSNKIAFYLKNEKIIKELFSNLKINQVKISKLKQSLYYYSNELEKLKKKKYSCKNLKKKNSYTYRNLKLNFNSTQNQSVNSKKK